MIKKTISKVLAGLLVSGLLTSATSAVYAENKVVDDVNFKLESIIKKLPKKGEAKFLQIDKILKEVLEEEVNLGNITQDESDKISEYLAKRNDLQSAEELPEKIKNKIGKIENGDFVLTVSELTDGDLQEIENVPEELKNPIDEVIKIKVTEGEVQETNLLSEDEFPEKIKDMINEKEDVKLLSEEEFAKVIEEIGKHVDAEVIEDEIQEAKLLSEDELPEEIKNKINAIKNEKVIRMKKSISDLEDMKVDVGFIEISDIDIFSELVEEGIISQEKADGIREKFIKKLKELKK